MSRKFLTILGIFTVALFGFASYVQADLEEVQTRLVTFVADISPSSADTSVTISVDGLLSARAKNAQCIEDPDQSIISYTDWYDFIATQTVPTNTAEITSGPFAGQTIPLSLVPGSTGSDCSFPGERTSVAGSKNFSTTAIANGTYPTNVRITDNRGIVANQSVNIVVSHPTPAPTVTLSASPTSVTSGTKTTLTWSSTNASSCTATAGNGFATGGATSGSDLSNNLTTQTTFTVSCAGAGGTAEKSVIVNISVPSLVCSPSTQTVNTGQSASFTASGGSGTIVWSATGGSPSTGGNSASFATTYSTTGNKTVTVSRGGSTANCAVSAIDPTIIPPDLSMSAPPSVVQGTAPTISWTVSGATSCVETPGLERWYWDLPASPHTDGSHSVVASLHDVAGTSRTYDMTCSNSSGSVSGSVTVGTTAPPPINTAPIVDIKINGGDGPISIASGASATLSWTASGNPNPTCTASNGWSGTKALTGSESTGALANPPTSSKTYILTCTNSVGPASDSVTININPQAPTQKTLSVTKSGTGTGTVTSSPGGISCGSDCGESYTNGTVVALSATPASGSTFGGWSGDADCSDGSVTMNTSKSCTATFNTGLTANVACQATPSTVSVGQQTQVRGFGGSGTRVWSAPGGTPDSQIGGSFFNVSYNSPGSKLITNTIGGSSGSCNVTVNPTTGTIQVNSWDITSGSRVAISSTWTVTGSGPTLTQATPSTVATYSNINPGTWTVSTTPPGGYSLSSVKVTSSQSVGAGNTTTYDIEYLACTHCAEYVTQNDVPSTMSPGEQRQVSITMRNTGTNVWTRTGNYRLGSVGDSTIWGPGRVQISTGVSVANGQEYTFPFTITAPSSDGTYNFQWRMLQEGVKWFGTRSPLMTITVVTAPPALSCSPPTQSVDTGEQASFTASGGSGNFSWSAPGGVPSNGGNVSNFDTTYSSTGSKVVTVSRGGASAICNVTVTSAPPPGAEPAVTLLVNGGSNPVTVPSGGSADLSWSVTGSPTPSCTASDGWSGTKSVPSGNENTGTLNNPPSTTPIDYTLTCTNSAGSDDKTVRVTVVTLPVPTVTLTANPTEIASGDSTLLTWTTTNSPTSCTASAVPVNGQWSGSVATGGGNKTINNITADTDFKIFCTNGAGSSSVVTAVVSTNPLPPTPIFIEF